MKKIALIFMVAIFLPIVVLSQGLISARTNEPTSNGKTLGYWLDQYTNSPESGRQEADKAIILCGTNALPWLLSELHATNSPLDLENINASSNNSGDSPADRRHWRAINCFRILGPIAKPAIGALTNMIISGENPLLTAYALTRIGTNSYSTLTNLMTHSDKNVRSVAVQAIEYYGYQSKQGGFAVPALVVALSDDSSSVRFSAAMAICVICENSELAVPALRKSLKDEERGVRLYSVRALGRYEEKSLIPYFVSDIIPMLNDPDHDVRSAAAYSLSKDTNHNAVVILAIAKSLTDTNHQVRCESALILGSIGHDAKIALPDLIKAFKDGSADDEAAIAIKKIDSEEAKILGIQ